ncbi:MAG: hypothetical protein P4L92_06410 [Rudaea sp.]|nr:hypothetical protein [Rudaea sp.]
MHGFGVTRISDEHFFQGIARTNVIACMQGLGGSGAKQSRTQCVMQPFARPFGQPEVVRVHALRNAYAAAFIRRPIIDTKPDRGQCVGEEDKILVQRNLAQKVAVVADIDRLIEAAAQFERAATDQGRWQVQQVGVEKQCPIERVPERPADRFAVACFASAHIQQERLRVNAGCVHKGLNVLRLVSRAFVEKAEIISACRFKAGIAGFSMGQAAHA